MMAHSKAKRGNKNNIYNIPLPIFAKQEPASLWTTRTLFPSSSYLSIFKPTCVGIIDEASKSVWIMNQRDISLLWQNGFFGKGSLSRSEPSWLERRTKQHLGTVALSAEEVTTKRRAERRQFKAERANAIAEAQAKAETLFAATGQLPSYSELGFMPSINRTVPSSSPPPASDSKPAALRPLATEEAHRAEGHGVEGMDLEPIQMEHLQLTLEEAFFLSWSLGSLKILDPNTDTYLPSVALLSFFLRLHTPQPQVGLYEQHDNPFIVRYAAYHYYRSLGWVVKGGIKFCVDYLLYKKGPVFHHAEFAVVLCPVYEDPIDEKLSLFALQNVYPFTWSWFSTLNRVNTQVKKSFTLAYVTIPSKERLSKAGISFSSPECLSLYTVREVVVRRFIPARVRD